VAADMVDVFLSSELAHLMIVDKVLPLELPLMAILTDFV
jgi:hypothetical protein